MGKIFSKQNFETKQKYSMILDTNKVFERVCLTVEKCALISYVEGKRQGYRNLSFAKSKFFIEKNSDFIDFWLIFHFFITQYSFYAMKRMDCLVFKYPF